MMEIAWGIVGLLIFVLFWAGSGHLIWKFVRWCLSGWDDAPNPSSSSKPHAPDPAIPNPESDLKSARRLLEYSVFREWLEPEQRQTLVDLLAKIEKRIGAPNDNKSIEVEARANERDVVKQVPDGPEIAPVWNTIPKPLRPVVPVLGPKTASAPVHALDIDYSDEKQVETAPKSHERLKTNLLQSFMERSNIRWIELVSAALIVVCSVGLVISLWSTLSKTNRFFPSVVFMLATVAVHGAGQYTLKKWKLRSTSRGILHIALMLIPLSVLVSILLVRREGEPPVFTITVAALLTVGTVVYGWLATTASRSLYGGRWRLLTSLTVLSSLSLVASYWTGQTVSEASAGQAMTIAGFALLPVISAACVVTLSVGRSVLDGVQLNDAICRRSLGMMTQVVFAMGISLCFAFLQWRANPQLMQALWIPLAGALSVLVAWGGSNCFGVFSRHREMSLDEAAASDEVRSRSQGGSVLTILSWLVAVLAAIGLLAVAWQGCDTRWSLIAMLIVVGIYWFAHGVILRVSFSLIGSLIAFLTAMGLLTEVMTDSSALEIQSLTALDWISFSRVAHITSYAIAGIVIGIAWQVMRRLPFRLFDKRETYSWSFGAPDRRWLHRDVVEANASKASMLAGAFLFMVSALLTFVACFVSAGETPLGGSWAPILLIGHGAFAISAAVAWQYFSGESAEPYRLISKESLTIASLCAMGQVFGLIGTIRLFHSSPLLASWLGEARPDHAWAIGVTLLSVVWAAIAIVCSRRFAWREPKSLQVALTAGALLAAGVSAVRLWLPTVDCDMSYAARFGWALPFILLCVWQVLRSEAFRELAILTLAAWCGVLFVTAQAYFGWYASLGLVGDASIATLISIIIVLVCDQWRVIRDRKLRLPQEGLMKAEPMALATGDSATKSVLIAPEASAYGSGKTAFSSGDSQQGKAVSSPPAFSLPVVSAATVLMLLGVLFGPALENALLSQRVISGIDSAARQSILNLSFVWLLVALASQGLMVAHLFRRGSQGVAWCVLNAMPFLLALGLSAWLASLWSFPAILWTLAVSILLSELIPLGFVKLREFSECAWEDFIGPVSMDSNQTQQENRWIFGLRCFRYSIIVALVLFTLVGATLALIGAFRLPEGYSSTAKTWIWFGPWMSVIAIRWLRVVWLCRSQSAVTLIGLLLALSAATFGVSLMLLEPYAVLTVTEPMALATGIKSPSVANPASIDQSAPEASAYGSGILMISSGQTYVANNSISDSISISIRFLQVFGFSLGAIAWLTLIGCFTKNLVTLRSLSPHTGMRSLLPKSAKGARWKRAEGSACTLSNIAVGVLVVLSIASAMAVIVYPQSQLAVLIALGGGWAIAVYIVALSIAAFTFSGRGASSFGIMAVGLGLLAPLASCIYANLLLQFPVLQFPGAQNFEPYRMLVTLWLVALSIGLSLRWMQPVEVSRTSFASQQLWVFIAIACGVLSFISSVSDPNPLWSTGQLVVLAILAAFSGVLSGQAWRGHVAAVLASAAVFLATEFGMLRGFPRSKTPLDVVWIALYGPVAVGYLSALLRLWLSRKQDEKSSQLATLFDRFTGARYVDSSVSLHVPFASLGLAALWVYASPKTIPSASQFGVPIGVLAVSTVGLALLRFLRPISWVQFVSFYSASLAFVSTSALIACTNLSLQREVSSLIWTAAIAAGACGLAFTLREMRSLSVRWRSSLSPEQREAFQQELSKVQVWMPRLHCVLGALLLLPTVWLVLASDTIEIRKLASLLPLLIATSILSIVGSENQVARQRTGLAFLSGAIFLFAIASVPTSWMGHGVSESWVFLQRVLVAGVAISWGYWGVGRYFAANASFQSNNPDLAADSQTQATTQRWLDSLFLFSWGSLGVAVVSGVSLIASSLVRISAGEIALAGGMDKAFLIGGFLALFARFILAAAYPSGSDLRLTRTVRKALVYLAEASVAALVAAIWLCFPDLFSGVLATWWPIVVFFIAMLSLGIGQLLSKTKLEILADPISRSALLLPVIPLAGVWWSKLGKDFGQGQGWANLESYSLLLLVAAGLYGLHSWLSRSIGFRVLSACLTLLAFWTLLHSQPDLRFFEHPQFWLLPPAIASLGFVEWNRSRLTVAAVTATRYTSVLIAYLSSTAEMMIRAFDGQFWPPLVLLIVSVVGMVAGFLTRVRAFLYCGTAFVFVGLLGMVWHAQQAIDQVWPWWAFGIAVGVTLIASLGYLEKNRPRVVAYLDSLK